MSLLQRIRNYLTAADVVETPPEDDSPMFSHGHTKVVIGLGNPGRQYAETRHNLGFFVVDELAKRTSAPTSRKRMKAEITEARMGDNKLILAMPQTYMNVSGVRFGRSFAGTRSPWRMF